MTTEKYIERTVTSGGGGGPDNSKSISAQEYLHSARVGVAVPLMQSTITGLVFAVPVLILLLKLRVEDAWYWGAGIWALAQAATWIVTQLHWFSLTNLEKITGLDLNKDGVVGEPIQGGEVVKTVRINVHEVGEGGALTVKIARFPLDEKTMEALADGLLSGVPFAESYWTGAGKILSKAQFQEVREEMLKRGLIEPRNQASPFQGFVLTRGGKAAMREFSVAPHYANPPSPTA